MFDFDIHDKLELTPWQRPSDTAPKRQYLCDDVQITYWPSDMPMVIHDLDNNRTFKSLGTGCLETTGVRYALMRNVQQKVVYLAVESGCCASFKSMFTEEQIHGIMTKQQITQMNMGLLYTPRDPVYTFHGVPETCHLWFRTDELQTKVKVDRFNFKYYGSNDTQMNYRHLTDQQLVDNVNISTIQHIRQSQEWEGMTGNEIANYLDISLRTYARLLERRGRYYIGKGRTSKLTDLYILQQLETQRLNRTHDFCKIMNHPTCNKNHKSLQSRLYQRAIVLAQRLSMVSLERYLQNYLDSIVISGRSVAPDFDWNQSFVSVYDTQTMIGQISYNTYEKHTQASKSQNRVHRVRDGTLIDVSDGWCAFKSIVQMFQGTPLELEEFYALARTLAPESPGGVTIQQVKRMLTGTSVFVANYDATIFKNPEVSLGIRTYTVYVDSEHAYAYIPKVKQQKDRQSIRIVSENISQMLGSCDLQAVETKQPMNVMQLRYPKQEDQVVDTLSKINAKVNERRQQPSKQTNVKSTLSYREQRRQAKQETAGTIKKDPVMKNPPQAFRKYKDPREVFSNTLYAKVSALKIEDLTEWNLEEAEAWSKIAFRVMHYQYIQEYPRIDTLQITTIASLKIATGLDRYRYPQFYAKTDKKESLRWQIETYDDDEFDRNTALMISGRDLLPVSKAALQTLGPQLLISLHQSQETRLCKPNPQKIKKMMASFLNISAQPAGIIPREYLEVLSKYGFELDSDMLRDQRSLSGGHSSIRFTIDMLQSESMTRIIKTVEDSIMVDVGAKYGSNGPLLQAATRYVGLDLKSRHDDNQYRAVYIYENLKQYFEVDGGTYKLIRPNAQTAEYWQQLTNVPLSLKKAMMDYISWMRFDHTLKTTSDRNEFLNQLQQHAAELQQDLLTNQNTTELIRQIKEIEQYLKTQQSEGVKLQTLLPMNLDKVVDIFFDEVMQRPRQWYVPVRPTGGDYNKVYHAEHYIKYHETADIIICPGQIKLTAVRLGNIEDYHSSDFQDPTVHDDQEPPVHYKRKMIERFSDFHTYIEEENHKRTQTTIARRQFRERVAIERRDCVQTYHTPTLSIGKKNNKTFQRVLEYARFWGQPYTKPTPAVDRVYRTQQYRQMQRIYDWDDENKDQQQYEQLHGDGYDMCMQLSKATCVNHKKYHDKDRGKWITYNPSQARSKNILDSIENTVGLRQFKIFRTSTMDSYCQDYILANLDDAFKTYERLERKKYAEKTVRDKTLWLAKKWFNGLKNIAFQAREIKEVAESKKESEDLRDQLTSTIAAQQGEREHFIQAQKYRWRDDQLNYHQFKYQMLKLYSRDLLPEVTQIQHAYIARAYIQKDEDDVKQGKTKCLDHGEDCESCQAEKERQQCDEQLEDDSYIYADWADQQLIISRSSIKSRSSIGQGGEDLMNEIERRVNEDQRLDESQQLIESGLQQPVIAQRNQESDILCEQVQEPGEDLEIEFTTIDVVLSLIPQLNDSLFLNSYETPLTYHDLYRQPGDQGRMQLEGSDIWFYSGSRTNWHRRPLQAEAILAYVPIKHQIDLKYFLDNKDQYRAYYSKTFTDYHDMPKAPLLIKPSQKCSQELKRAYEKALIGEFIDAKVTYFTLSEQQYFELTKEQRMKYHLIRPATMRNLYPYLGTQAQYIEARAKTRFLTLQTLFPLDFTTDDILDAGYDMTELDDADFTAMTKNYTQQFIQLVKHCRTQSKLQKHELFKKLLTTNNKVAGRACQKIQLFMNDVHYYLNQFTPSYDCMMYITGVDFYSFPGFYRLPCNEGSYTISATDQFQAKVVMQTQGSNQKYSHPLVKVYEQTKRIDFGWLSMFQKIYVHRAGDPTIFHAISMPIAKQLKSIQDNFIIQYHQLSNIEVEKFKTLTYLQSQALRTAYSQAEIEDILKTGFATKREFDSLWQKTKALFYKRNGSVPLEQAKSFIYNLNYEQYRTVEISQSNTYLSFFTIQRTTRMVENFDCQSIWAPGWTRWIQYKNAVIDADKLDNVLIAGRTQEAHTLSESMFGKNLTQIPTKEAVKIYQSTKEKVEPTEKYDSVAVPIDYYAVKPMPEPLKHNPLVLDTSVFNQTAKNLQQWQVYHNAQNEQIKVQQPVVQCGYQILKDNQAINSFEWSTKSPQNQYAALIGRQLAPQTSVDEKVLIRYAQVASNYIHDLTQAMMSDPQLTLELRNFDPFEWLDTKVSFDEGKKQKYFKTIHMQYTSRDPSFISSFKSMTKAGEVQTTTQQIPTSGAFYGEDGKPRNISIPSASTCGTLTAIQSILMPAIQRYDTGFVQACTKEELQRRVTQKLLRVKPKQCISLDGSNFDSTQYQCLQEIVDVSFWRNLESHIVHHYAAESSVRPTSSAFVQNLIRDATCTQHLLFVPLNNDKDYIWTQKQRSTFLRDWPRAPKDFMKMFIPIDIKGTTFSGHPTFTTLGNTLRSITYVIFYASEIKMSKEFYDYIAAGDDVVIFIYHTFMGDFVAVIYLRTNQQNSQKSGTLGQIVKIVEIREWDDFIFCSKWVFSTGSYQSLCFTRDVEKTLKTRLYYNGQNQKFLSHPDLYCSALYEGFQSEHTSHLVEDILMSRIITFTPDQSKNFPYKFEAGGSYQFEDQVNARLHITVRDLYLTIQKQQLIISGRDEQVATPIQIEDYYLFNNITLNAKNIDMSTNANNNNNNNNNQNADKKSGNRDRDNKRAQKSNNEWRQKVVPAPQLYTDTAGIKEKKSIGKMSYKEVHEAVVKNDGSEVIKLVDHLKNKSRSQLIKAIGWKMASINEPNLPGMTLEEQKTVMAEVLADDWKDAIKSITRPVAKYVWSAFKNSSYYPQAKQVVRDYLGYDLNDDRSRSYNIDPGFNRSQIDWTMHDSSYASLSSQLDGVSCQAIASILCPSLCSSRVPTDAPVKTGVVTKTYAFNLTTNASGNACFILRPYQPESASWYRIYNDATFSATTWAQTPNSTTYSGPIPSGQGLDQIKLTATSVRVEPIVSTLNDQGTVTTFMSSSNTAESATAAPVTSVTVRDCEYVLYGSLKQSMGHRLVIASETDAQQELRQIGVPTSMDFMGITVLGAAASTAVLQVIVDYQVEYTAIGNILLQLAPPPLGIATYKALSSGLSQNPRLRTLGNQESVQLFEQLISCEPTYQKVLQVLADFTPSQLPS